MVDERQNKIGSEFIWLLIAIDLAGKEILGFSIISEERNMSVANRFLFNL
jgi:transposase-like protein